MFRYDNDLKQWTPFGKLVSYTTKYEYYTDDDYIDPSLPDLIVAEIMLTDEQEERLERAKHIEDMGIEALTKYVMTEELPVDNPGMVEADKQARTRKALIASIDVSAIPPEILIESGLTKEWDDTSYFTMGEPITKDGVIYKVLQSHAKQPDWTPDKALSLFAKVLTSPVGPLPWVQPESTNQYVIGDKITFEGKTYESLINANVWPPTAYPQGWMVV